LDTWRAAALLAGAVIYASGVNRNGLYLSMVFSAYVLASFLWRRGWPAALVLAGAVWLAAVPAAVPPVKFIEPSPSSVAGQPPAGALPPGTTWIFRFRLWNLGHYLAESPMAGTLNLDGRDLEGLAITLNGHPWTPGVATTPKYGIEHAAIPIGRPTGAYLEVALRALPGQSPVLSQGAEADRRAIYPDAIWLEFAGPKESVIYQARRQAVEAVRP
jgi:hypothetical protein